MVVSSQTKAERKVIILLQELKAEKAKQVIGIIIALVIGFLLGFTIRDVDASELDTCKSIIYSRTRMVRHATESAQNLCRAEKLQTEKCDKIGKQVLRETLATLPKLDNNFILKCEKRGVYATVDRI